jgi:glutamyl aminopeptidase
MDWWNDLWLNEGFASYIEYKGVNSAQPEWNLDQFFLNDDMHAVMRLDARESSHPIINSAQNPNQITQYFNSISYKKGASVLRMLEHTIGSDIFEKAIHNYLVKYSYSNARTDDLWEEFNKELGDVILTYF